MSTTQTPRVDSRFADYEEDYNDNLTPKAGVKRTYSKRDSRRASSDAVREYFEDADELEFHSEKRYRSSEWPLRNPSTAGSRNITPQSKHARSRNTPGSTPRARNSSSQIRPSKFVEGSMNDRVSNKPPMPYLGDEEMRERFEREEQARGRKMAQPRKYTHHSNTSIAGSYAERSDTSRHSSIFKFGKSIAATFNPSNWKIWAKPQVDAETPDHNKVLRERKEKAEAIYQELKRNGQFRDSTVPPSFGKSREGDLAKHDSGVVLERVRDSSVPGRQEKRQGKVFLDPPRVEEFGHSPGSHAGSASGSVNKKSGLRLRRPSLSKIIRHQSSEAISSTPNSGDHQQARRISSRKDLQKQQKLVKRVSDLEMKLDSARRQLSESLGQPMPISTPHIVMQTTSRPPLSRIGRPRFVPGALATLPSERLLAGYVSPGDDEDAEMEDPSEEFEVSSRMGRAVIMTSNTLDQVIKPEPQEKASGNRNGSRKAASEASGKSYAERLKSKTATTPLDRAVAFGTRDVVDETEASTSSDELAPPHEHQLNSDRAKSHVSQGRKSREHSREPTGRKSTAKSNLEGYSQEEPTRKAPKPPTATRSEKAHTTFAPEASTRESEPTETSDEEHEAVEEPMQQDHAQKVSPPKSKKRKSFERVIDKSGTYMPESDDDNESDYEGDTKKKTTPRKTGPSNTARPHKLQKTITLTHKASPRKQPPATPHASKSSPPQNQRQSATRYQKPVRATGSAVSRSSSKLTKNNTHTQLPRASKVQQSMSPPPTSSFGTIDYRKPSSQGLRADSEEHTAIPGEGDVPPIPQFPKVVRLASGEVIRTATAPRAKLSKKRPAVDEDRSREDADEKDNSDGWPAYVF